MGVKMKIEEHHGSYRVRKTCKGVTYTATFDQKPTDKEALIAITRIIEEADSCKKGSFEELATRYIEGRKNVVSPSTVRTYQTKLKQLSDEFKKMNVKKLINADVQEEISRLAEKLEPKTVKTTYGFIASVLTEFKPNLRLRVKLPQIIKKVVYEPTNEDIRRILDEVKGTDYSIPFQLGILGCRRGEICALSFDDLTDNNLFIHRTMVYDENGNWIVKETPKTEESNRILPLPEPLAEEIRKQGYIYNNHPNALNKEIHRVQKRLGIPAFKFHALRSYFASYAHSIGIPEADILKLGGWATPSVMERVYRKSLEESKKESMDKLTQSLF